MKTWDYLTNFPRLFRRRDPVAAIIAGAADYCDGETSINRCIEMYCADHGITDEALIERAQYEEFKRGALEAGIPLSVIEGKSKLSDHFSREYIDHKAGRK